MIVCRWLGKRVSVTREKNKGQNMGTDRNENWQGTLQQVIMTIWPTIVEVNQLGAYH